MGEKKISIFRYAFVKTIPVMTGFLFLGFAYGMLMHQNGYGLPFVLLTTICVFGGSLEFLIVAMLAAPFAPIQTLIMACIIQARHIFYGISMLEKYKGTGKWKPFLIFTMCDESFSINYSTEIPEGMNKTHFYVIVSALNYSYWVVGSALGSILGTIISLNMEGLDFVMTAMFVVIFLDQFKKSKQKYSAIIGIGASIVCRLLFSADQFIIPTMIAIIVLLTVFRKPISEKGEFEA